MTQYCKKKKKKKLGKGITKETTMGPGRRWKPREFLFPHAFKANL
jgi:hypothetical protein